MTQEHNASEQVRTAIEQACTGLVQRESLVEMVVLCAVAREHLLVLGPPGTAKSEAVRRIARGLGGSYFEYLLGRFTEPTELFGAIDLAKLKEGTVETQTDGMLPEAEIAFLDEVFLGSTAILNTLLGVLNERTYRRGHTIMRCPLRVCVGASNHLPEESYLAAFADRFLVRMFVSPVGDSSLEHLLSSGWTRRSQATGTSLIHQIDALSEQAMAMDLGRVRPALAHGIRLLRQAGIELSDRRIVSVQRLIAAAAALAARPHPTEADLWPVVFALPTEHAQSLGREVLHDLLSASQNATVGAATEESSLGPLARATRIVREGTALLQAPPVDPDQRHAWLLQLESVARETDATFSTENIPSDLAELRTVIVETLGAGSDTDV